MPTKTIHYPKPCFYHGDYRSCSIDPDTGLHYVECTLCLAQAGTLTFELYPTQDEAIIAWNKQQDELDEKRLHEFIEAQNKMADSMNKLFSVSVKPKKSWYKKLWDK